MTNYTREYNKEVSKVVNEIKEKIPEGFEILLGVKKGSYRIELFNKNANEVHVWTDYDTPGLDLLEHFEHAIELASNAVEASAEGKMPTREECKQGIHTLDNQGLCYWCGELLDRHLWADYLWAQKQPSSVARIEAQTKYVKRELDQADRRTASTKTKGNEQ